MLSRWKVLTKTFPRFLPQRQKGNIGRHLWDGVDILRSFYAKDKPTVLPAIHQELGVSGNSWLAYKTFDVSFKSEEWRSFNRMDWIPYYYKISNIKIEYKNKQIPTYCWSMVSSSLRKWPTFRDTTTGFCKMTSEERLPKSWQCLWSG